MTIAVQGVEEIKRKLAGIHKAAETGIQASAVYVEGVAKKYPRAGDWNKPGPYPKTWYNRGEGSEWALKGGGTHKSVTSLRLKEKWTVKYFNGNLSAEVGNNVPYGPYVMGDKDQAPYHKAHGWKTTGQIVKETAAKIQQFIKDAITKALMR
jgi:hypothetical protein